MDRQQRTKQPIPTIWEIPDDVWPMRQTMLDEHYPAKPTGHRRVDLRRVLNGILVRLRTGCPWHQLPTQFGDDRPVQRHVQHWCQQGLFARLWAALVQECAALNGVDWPWQAADTMMGQARMGGDLVGRHPTDRGNKG
jgi:transposase